MRFLGERIMRLGILGLGIAAGLAFSSAANAQIAGVTGIFAEGALGVRATSSEVTNPFGPDLPLRTDVGERGFLGSLRAGWRGDMPEFDFGASVFWNPADEDAGRTIVGNASAKVKQWEHWGIGAEAGWKVAAPTTVYARLEWHRAKFQLDSTLPGAGAPSIRSSKRLNGWGYGFGVRHVFQQNHYVFAEWQQIEFEDGAFSTAGVTTAGRGKMEPRSTLGLIGVGMKF